MTSRILAMSCSTALAAAAQQQLRLPCKDAKSSGKLCSISACTSAAGFADRKQECRNLCMLLQVMATSMGIAMCACCPKSWTQT